MKKITDTKDEAQIVDTPYNVLRSYFEGQVVKDSYFINRLITMPTDDVIVIGLSHLNMTLAGKWDMAAILLMEGPEPVVCKVFNSKGEEIPQIM